MYQMEGLKIEEIETEDLPYAFWLSSIKGIGSRKIKALLNYFGTPKDVFYGKSSQFAQISNLQARDRETLSAPKDFAAVKSEYESLGMRGIHFVCAQQAEFPQKLRHIPDSPYSLFYKGSLPLESVPSIAVVGAREASYESIALAKSFGRALAQNGLQVISGMARGIDIAAQRGALEVTRGRTYSLLGTGVDLCYPRSHIEEYMQMQENGGILSEFPLKTQPYPYHFPLRNRLISGLSDGILVIEARQGSGSLITAQMGLEQGKEIFVLPGTVGNPRYVGSNDLLKGGACLVTDVRDILDGLGLFFDRDVTEQKKKSIDMLETSEKMVYAMLSLEPVHVAQLVSETGMELPIVMKSLLSLQDKHLVQVRGNQYFSIRL